ncbi:efflux RND transporter permease subunit [Rhizobium sp. L1K21]|uniref:efflux RND transporter permease subunit n=1 Tax=Rhizobium sp. L1K21 TaxID=2954933 RepID=UPI0020934F1C|nr:efflux RND transporter permease subunit [Rhizobium sp. L1K21]MCO6185694.1 efflux RND transporter permease subunit [Rhizobium sp. L1K21]
MSAHSEDDHLSASASFTAIFVRRPILALVLNALIVVAGLAAYYGVEVRELPQVDRPVVTVRAEFAGASPETMDREVTSIIEGAVARVSGIADVSSRSTQGNSRVTIEFNDDVDISVAANDVRDAVGRIENQLPDDVDAPTIVKADDDSQPVMRLAVTSSTLSMDDLTVLVENQIEDTLAAVNGVADVSVYGEQDKIFRVDVDQAKLAGRGLTIADLGNALSTVTLDVPAGSLTNASQNIVVRATAQLTEPEEFENLIIANRVRLGDVATVTVGAADGTTALRSDGKTGIGLGIIRQAQSNTLEISKGIHAAVERIQANLPEGTQIVVSSDDAVFIQGSLDEVVNALAIAVVIVVVVIFLFLRDWRATIIPAVTMPVALIGTLAAIYLAGFSINILTLLAIVLATGMVVDDAIVVLENIVRRKSEGLGLRAAAVIGTREVFFAVIATTATLAAVFVPISFLPGQTGGLFREFGFVLAFAVMLSSFVALTLCPMLASRLLKKGQTQQDSGQEDGGFIGRAFAGFYARTLRAVLDVPVVVFVIAIIFTLAAFGTFGLLTREVTPREDRSVVLASITTPPGVSLDYTREQIRRVEEKLLPMRDNGELRRIFSISGFGGSTNRAFMVMTLAPWGERERSQDDIVKDINARLAQVPSVQAFAIQPNSLGIRGGGQGLQLAILGNNYETLNETATKLIAALEDSGKFNSIRLNNEPTQAQLSVSIDRERAADLGISISGLSVAIQALLDGRSVGDVYVDGRAYPVTLLSSTNPINDPGDLENIFLKTEDGRIVPMSTIATLQEKAISPTLERNDQMRSVSLSMSMNEGLSLGGGFDEATRIAETVLPPGYRVIPLAEAATLQQNSQSLATTFGFAVVIIFLVLAAQFESVVSALIIMATVPLGLACAVFAMYLTGNSLNVYSQIGLVMLVGIMAKNGILIVEFANQLRDRGEDVRSAIENACRIRLRPVMMTMISTVLGGVPLILAHGAGAEARVALGWVVVGGLGLATIVTLYLTPVAYLAFARFSKPHADEERRLHEEMLLASQMAGE